VRICRPFHNLSYKIEGAKISNNKYNDGNLNSDADDDDDIECDIDSNDMVMMTYIKLHAFKIKYPPV
jgi:hypothetical protein